MNKGFIKNLFTLCAIVISFNSFSSEKEITVYSSRTAHLIEPLLDEFTKDTGIKAKLLTGDGNALIERIKLEGRSTHADIFMTVDAGNLWYASSQDIFQPMKSETVISNIPNHLRDPDNLWTGLSVRARTIVYSNARVNADELSTYEDLASKKWKGRLCLRTSKKIYNKSLVASLIHHLGEEGAGDVVEGWVSNLATSPHSKDTKVMEAIMAGQCDVGIVNTYYYIDQMKKTPNAQLKLFWPNQKTTGVHVNISGAGIVKHSKHIKESQQLIDYLTGIKAQQIYMSLNSEYPANPNVKSVSLDRELGTFNQDKMNLSQTGILQSEAVKLMQRKKYK